MFFLHFFGTIHLAFLVSPFVVILFHALSLRVTLTYAIEAALSMDESGISPTSRLYRKVFPNAFSEIRPNTLLRLLCSLCRVRMRHSERKAINHKERTCYRKCPTRDTTTCVLGSWISPSLWSAVYVGATRSIGVCIVGEHTITYVMT
jgi:hypothetical protein